MASFFVYMEKAKQISMYVFIAIEAILWVLFSVFDLCGVMNTTYIKYASIVIAFAFSFINFKNKRTHIFILAMLLTLISDFFLLVLIDNGIRLIDVSLITFIGAQLAHAINVNETKKLIKYSLITRGGLFILLLVTTLLLNGCNLTSFLVSFYFANLVTNALDSGLQKYKYHYLFMIGFILFIGCDICVGYSNSIFYGNNDLVDRIICFGMWFFYLPSQTILVFTNYLKGKEKNESKE